MPTTEDRQHKYAHVPVVYALAVSDHHDDAEEDVKKAEDQADLVEHDAWNEDVGQAHAKEGRRDEDEDRPVWVPVGLPYRPACEDGYDHEHEGGDQGYEDKPDASQDLVHGLGK